MTSERGASLEKERKNLVIFIKKFFAFSKDAPRSGTIQPRLRLYYKLTKPGIVYSNVMTAAAGYLFGAKKHIDSGEMLALLIGTALIIASACVFNNYLDRGIDAKMSRTKKRALASGKISASSALTFASILGVFGFAILSFTNALTMTIGFVAIFSYVIVYGAAKRKSVHGTLVGTVPGAASLVAGYSVATDHLDSAALLLFLVMLSWQMAHFYSIAIFRLDDYKSAKIPVMPAMVGIKDTKLQIMLYVFTFVLSCVALCATGQCGLTFLVVMGCLGLYWLYTGVKGFGTKDDAKWARGIFGLSLINLTIFCIVLAANP